MSLWLLRHVSVASETFPCGHRDMTLWPKRNVSVIIETCHCGRRDMSLWAQGRILGLPGPHLGKYHIREIPSLKRN